MKFIMSNVLFIINIKAIIETQEDNSIKINGITFKCDGDGIEGIRHNGYKTISNIFPGMTVTLHDPPSVLQASIEDKYITCQVISQ